MLNIIWLSLIIFSVIIGAINGTIPDVVASVTTSAKDAFMLVLGLVGIMALWLGIMKIAEDAGLIALLSRALRPVLHFLFPQVPKDHPALGAITLNLSANMLGVGNAATPFGLRAMQELEKLNPLPGTATHDMCMLVAINTSSIQLIPATAIAILASNGDPHPTRIIVPVLIATLCSTIAAISAAKLCARWSKK
jgi:spore maturation protein A